MSLCEEIAVANGIFVIDHSQKENPKFKYLDCCLSELGFFSLNQLIKVLV